MEFMAGFGEKWDPRSWGGGFVKNVWRVERRDWRVVVRVDVIWDC